MFEYFTFVSLVLNLIYSKQLVLLYVHPSLMFLNKARDKLSGAIMVPINQHETNVEMIGSNNTTKLLFTALFTAVKSFGAPVTGQCV
jgi:hypothetical protein